MLLSQHWERNETERKVATVLEQVAAKVGAKTIQAGTSDGSRPPPVACVR